MAEVFDVVLSEKIQNNIQIATRCQPYSVNKWPYSLKSHLFGVWSMRIWCHNELFWNSDSIKTLFSNEFHVLISTKTFQLNKQHHSFVNFICLLMISLQLWFQIDFQIDESLSQRDSFISSWLHFYFLISNMMQKRFQPYLSVFRRISVAECWCDD